MLWEPLWLFYSSWISGVGCLWVASNWGYAMIPWNAVPYPTNQHSLKLPYFKNILASVSTSWKERSTHWIFHEASAYFFCPFCSRQKEVSLPSQLKWTREIANGTWMCSPEIMKSLMKLKHLEENIEWLQKILLELSGKTSPLYPSKNS